MLALERVGYGILDQLQRKMADEASARLWSESKDE